MTDGKLLCLILCWGLLVLLLGNIDVHGPVVYDHPTIHEYRMGVQLCRISRACVRRE